jgi:DNA-binding transcriptional LysR family regulator
MGVSKGEYRGLGYHGRPCLSLCGGGVREAVLAGTGYTIASEWMFTAELQCGSVVSILDDWALPDVELFVVFPTGRQASVKARAFAAFMENQLARLSPSS